MPELPEVETARRLIADLGLGRRIADVDDADTFVCRPQWTTRRDPARTSASTWA
jgi:formamidopyrimidine-DNA glycosylase